MSLLKAKTSKIGEETLRLVQVGIAAEWSTPNMLALVRATTGSHVDSNDIANARRLLGHYERNRRDAEVFLTRLRKRESLMARECIMPLFIKEC